MPCLQTIEPQHGVLKVQLAQAAYGVNIVVLVKIYKRNFELLLIRLHEFSFTTTPLLSVRQDPLANKEDIVRFLDALQSA